jgi:hypothetical protein
VKVGPCAFAFSLCLRRCALSVPAFAASRNFTVTGFDRIRVDGPFMVRVTTGVAPFARAERKAGRLDGVSIEVQGQTLVVRRNPSGWGGYPGDNAGPVEISVGTHDLSTVWVNGAGSLAIDKAKGQSFDLSVQGPGSVSIGRLTVDRLKAGSPVVARRTVGGTAAQVDGDRRGTSTFDGSGLTSKDATIGAEGTAVVKLIATGTAKIDSLRARRRRDCRPPGLHGARGRLGGRQRLPLQR